MKFLILVLIVTCIFIFLIVLFSFKRKINIWLWSYLFGSWREKYKSKKPIHIIFCFVDHFEPHHGQVTDEKANKRMELWVKKYPKLAKKYIDADGNFLKHTWFYPYDELKEEELIQLNSLCQQGFGEVEFHLHHKNDTEESLRKKLKDGLKIFNEYGIGITEENKIAYGFIHGNWALNNSVHRNGENFCGVNDELRVLKETGCFADFTFPAYMSKSQPATVNSIFYAKSSTNKIKGHDKGKIVEINKSRHIEPNELMIIQGPLAFNWRKRKLGLIPTVEDGNIHEGNLFNCNKVDLWEKVHISIKGKPDWVFIKIFTHGAPEKNHNAVLGPEADKLFTYVIKKYCDKNGYKLHFVTAREMYNIIKAGEDGLEGSPNVYRNYKIKKYKNIVQSH